jgi:hypothetical protein
MLRNASLYGCGLRVLGIVPLGSGEMQATLWLTLTYVPLLPLGTWRVTYAGESMAIAEGVDDILLFRKLKRLPLDFAGAVKTLCVGWAVFVIAFGPLVVVFLRVMNRAANNVEIVLLFASILWLCGVAFYHMHWQKRSAERAREANPDGMFGSDSLRHDPQR